MCIAQQQSGRLCVVVHSFQSILMDLESQDMKGLPTSDGASIPVRKVSRGRVQFRIVIVIVGALLLFFVMQQVLNPFGDNEYAEIPHGDHSHFVPKDRDPNVPISNFPRQPPGENERITSDGRIVPK